MKQLTRINFQNIQAAHKTQCQKNKQPNQKVGKRPKCKLRNLELLEENIGKTLDVINQSKILYDLPPRVIEIKTKVNKWDLIKLKSFCAAKETISKVNRQLSELEKIIANETRVNFQNIQAAHTTQCQKNKQPNQNVGKRLKQTTLQRRHTDG